MEIKGKIILKKGKEYSILRYHPWIFSGAIQKLESDIEDGSWVEVVSYKNETLGFGHFQRGSITVRILSFGSDRPTQSFWREKFAKAIQLRKHSSLPSDLTNAFRLIHGEGDGLSGLIIDYYNQVAVMQAHNIGIHKDRVNIAQGLLEAFNHELKAIYYKSQTTLPDNGRGEQFNEYLYGLSGVPHTIIENGNSFQIDWEEGQKTGFFLDQRENRRLLGEFAKDKIVLNTFCYTGGFSIYALKAGAALVHSVDASERAIDFTRKNIILNGFDNNLHECFAVDTFDFIKDKQNHYDVIVLDPPAFAKHRDARHQAVKGYQRLNTEAIKAIKPGGIIFTFSCSQVVDKALFYNTIVSSALQAGREVKVLQHLCQPADHPISVFHPEGEYLKGLVLYVE